MGPNKSPEIPIEAPAGTNSPNIATASREPRGTRRWFAGGAARTTGAVATVAAIAASPLAKAITGFAEGLADGGPGTETPAKPETKVEPFYRSPQGYLVINNLFNQDPNRQLTDGINPGPEDLREKWDQLGTQWDTFLSKYETHVSFKRDPNLKKPRLGSYYVYLDDAGKQLYALYKPDVSPEKRTIDFGFNYLMPDQVVTPEFLTEESRLINGAIAAEMSKIVFGKSWDQAAEESYEELQRVGQLNPELNRMVEQPLQMVAPTTTKAA